jgi:outer membrane protein
VHGHASGRCAVRVALRILIPAVVLGWLLRPGTPAISAQQSPLDDYVAEGLSRNLTLMEERLALARADAGVRQARGRWLPSLTFNARYSERSGDILDLGDLVNPAFGALNQLLGSDQFPTDVSLKQPYKQETVLRLTQPLFLPAASAGVTIARNVREGQAAATGAAIRRIAAGIRLAYLDLARATRVAELARATLALLEENLRVSQALVDHGAATPDVLLRARADRSEGEQRLAEAGRLVEAARGAFNLLLERPLEQQVELSADSALRLSLEAPLDRVLASGLATREELHQLDAGVRAAAGQERQATSAFLPTLVAAVDYGFQGERYRFAADRDFLIASLVLQWNLFNGGQDRARRDQARFEGERLRTEREATRRRIELEIRTAWRAAEVAGQARATAADRLASAERNYGLVERKYRAGAAPQIELIDARTSYTGARLNLILTTYDYFARCVDLDRAAALYPVPPMLKGAGHD